MKRILISSVAVIAMFGAAATVLESRTSPTDKSITFEGRWLEEVQATVDANKLPTLEFEDMALVYSTPAKLAP